MKEFMKVRKIQRRLEEIEKTIYEEAISLSEWKFQEIEGQEEIRPKLKANNWKEFTVPNFWGGKDVTGWFEREVIIPEALAGHKVVMLLDLGCEALVFINGRPAQGLNRGRKEVLLTENAREDEQFKVTIEAYSGLKEERPGFSESMLAIVNEEVRDYYYNLKVALEATLLHNEGTHERVRLLDDLNASVDLVNYEEPKGESYLESIRAADQLLKERIYSNSENRVVEACRGRRKVWLSGHSHLDVAWGWPLRETIRKTARTFSSTLKYMDEFPDWCFSQSQPQLYEFAKEHYPELYEEIKRRVKEGRWEPIGAAWVEMDCNLVGGESLVRQILFGQRFFKQEFGMETETLWLPDVFGYTWALPQIMRRSGLKYFMTAKLLWNEFNQYPNTIFRWQGLDGSEVMTCFPPAFYGGGVTPERIKQSWDRFEPKGLCDEVLMLYGHGDGGGGVDKVHLEYAKRLARSREEQAGAKLGRAEDFFRKMEEKTARSLSVWNGELYFETHRGTFTTLARVKKYNRKSEFLYRDAELFSSIAQRYGADYRQKDLNQGWKKILLNQFHDILPGSSIREVYEDADRDFREIFQIGQSVLDGALKCLASRIDTRGEGKALIVFNSLPWLRSDIVKARLEDIVRPFKIFDPNGREVPYQFIGKDTVVFIARDLPPMGYAVYRVVEGETVQHARSLKVTVEEIENSVFRIALDEKGEITSIYDKRWDREVLAEGQKGNQFQTFEDKPNEWEAWNIDIFYRDKPLEVFRTEKIEVVEEGPVRAAVRITKRSKQSTIVQDIVLHDGLDRIDFATRVDWWEKRILLKAAFPVEVHSNFATYDIQFGNMERPTHWNTDWERAKYEVWAHKWADLSEGDYGVSLLNDCKYGYDIKDNLMRLTLLRGTLIMGASAERGDEAYNDQGKHEFVYALYPHKDGWRQGHTVHRGYELNVPPLTLFEASHAGDLPSNCSFVQVDRENVMIETLKKAEDSDDLVLRVYESYNQRGQVTISFASELKQVVECDLMERDLGKVKFSRRSFSFYIKPYEIRSFKVRF